MILEERILDKKGGAKMNEYAKINEMCSRCKGHATIINYPIKLCKGCYKKYEKGGTE